MKSIMTSFRVSEAEAQAIKYRAEREQVSASELLRRALAAYLTPPAEAKPTRRAATQSQPRPQ